MTIERQKTSDENADDARLNAQAEAEATAMSDVFSEDRGGGGGEDRGSGGGGYHCGGGGGGGGGGGRGGGVTNLAVGAKVAEA